MPLLPGLEPLSLADRLEALADPGTNTPQHRSPAPSGWEPGVRFEPDGSRVVTVPPSPTLADEASWVAAVQSLGVDVPDGYRVRLVEARYDPAAWHRDEQGDDAVTRPVWRYRFVVEVAPARIDVDDLLKSVRARRQRDRAVSGTDAPAFVFAVGDLQLGKPDGDGTPGTVQRFLQSCDRATSRYKALRKAGKVAGAVLVVAGDCPEGTQSQGGNLITRLDLTLTEQIRVLRRLMAEAVTALASLTDDLLVVAVPGNHGEATRVGNQMATRYDDSWDIEALSQVADVVAAKGYDVKWLFPGRDEMHVVADVNGTRLGVLHGHQTRGKMQNWLANKALDRDPIGTADVVLSGHHHTLRIEHLGPTTWMQTGALDGGSTWWNHRGGLTSPPAAITFLTSDGVWNGLEVV